MNIASLNVLSTENQTIYIVISELVGFNVGIPLEQYLQLYSLFTPKMNEFFYFIQVFIPFLHPK